MKESVIDPKLIGTNCIVNDPVYGTYKAVIRGGHKGFSDLPRVDVTIVECITPPSDKAILYKDFIAHRKPYAPGSIQHFEKDQVTPLLEVTA